MVPVPVMAKMVRQAVCAAYIKGFADGKKRAREEGGGGQAGLRSRGHAELVSPATSGSGQGSSGGSAKYLESPDMPSGHVRSHSGDAALKNPKKI